jgi:hypothetical protein
MKKPGQSKARALARTKKELEEKWAVLRIGEMSVCPEYDAYAHWYLSGGRASEPNAEQYIEPLILRMRHAMQQGDHDFFDRMTKLTKHFSQDFSKVGWADWLGAKVLEAAHLLFWEEKKVTPTTVSKILNASGFFRKGDPVPESGYDEGQIRKVMKRVGLIEWAQSHNQIIVKFDAADNPKKSKVGH